MARRGPPTPVIDAGAAPVPDACALARARGRLCGGGVDQPGGAAHLSPPDQRAGAGLARVPGELDDHPAGLPVNRWPREGGGMTENWEWFPKELISIKKAAQEMTHHQHGTTKRNKSGQRTANIA